MSALLHMTGLPFVALGAAVGVFYGLLVALPRSILRKRRRRARWLAEAEARHTAQRKRETDELLHALDPDYARQLGITAEPAGTGAYDPRLPACRTPSLSRSSTMQNGNRIPNLAPARRAVPD